MTCIDPLSVQLMATLLSSLLSGLCETGDAAKIDVYCT